MTKFLFENLETEEIFTVIAEGESEACDLALEQANHVPLRFIGEVKNP